MSASDPQTVIAIYRIRADKEKEFQRLLGQHHPTLKSLGLVTDEEPVIYRGEEKSGGAPVYFEIFSWIDEKAPDTAHQTPEVARVWEAMGTLAESRDGRPKFEFPHVRRIRVPREA